jgi:ethanolamine utilization protein EutM
VQTALGTVETRGLVAAVEAADAMLKSARVTISDFSIVGSGLVAVVVSGDVAAVQAAVDSGRVAAERTGELISWNVIPNPTDEVAKLIE